MTTPLHRRLISPITALGLLAWAGTALAASITGTVTNRTTGKPASGDTVTLIRLSQGMQEAGETTTDAKGHFTLNVNDDGVHLVRVTHDKATYFQPVQPGQTSVDIDVYTAAAKVPGVATEADVLHIQTDPSGKQLSVVESFFIKNASTPPKTEFGDHSFEFYLPKGAVVEGSVALGPGAMSMPVKSAPVPLGDPDHYAFVFPIRPCVGDAATDTNCGETRFQVSYHLPYSGSFSFTPRVAMPIDTLAVMLPKSMSFKPASGVEYAAATEELNAQAFVERNVTPGEPLGFTISGAGQLPRDTQAQSQQQGAAAGQTDAQQGSSNVSPAEASAAQRADTKPGVGLANPLDSEGNLEPWAKYKWWILGGLGLALAAGAGMMMKGSNPATAPAGPTGPVAPTGPAAVPAGRVASQGSRADLLQALKDELFALETDRVSGRLSDTEYAEQRSALDTVLRRAIARNETARQTTNI